MATPKKPSPTLAKPPAARKAATPPAKAPRPAVLPKSDGDAGVQACIASLAPWQAALARRVDALLAEEVPALSRHCGQGQGLIPRMAL